MKPSKVPAGVDLTAAEVEALLDGIGTAFSRLRRRTMQVPVDPPVRPTDLRHDLLLTAAEESPDGVSVGDIAARLTIDSPAASRLTAVCVAAGQLVRVASQVDGRRTLLQLTPEGARVLAHSRHQQRQAYEHITRDWPTEQRIQLAYLLDKYARDSNSTTAGTPPRPGSPSGTTVQELHQVQGPEPQTDRGRRPPHSPVTASVLVL